MRRELQARRGRGHLQFVDRQTVVGVEVHAIDQAQLGQRIEDVIGDW